MRFFLDTADLDEIAEAASWGALAGVTTTTSSASATWWTARCRPSRWP